MRSLVALRALSQLQQGVALYREEQSLRFFLETRGFDRIVRKEFVWSIDDFFIRLLECIEEIEDFEGSPYVFSAILKANTIAQKAFTRKNEDFHFHRICDYETLSLLRRFSLRPRTNKLRARWAFAEETERIKAFLCQANKSGLLEEDYSSEINRRLVSWEGLRTEDFLLVENADFEILCVCAPWKSPWRRWKLSSLPRHLKPLEYLAGALGSVELKEELPMFYLTALKFNPKLDNKTGALDTLLGFLYSEYRLPFGTLLSFLNQGFKLGSIRTPTVKTQASLYQVLSTKHLNRSWLLEPGAFQLEVAIM